MMLLHRYLGRRTKGEELNAALGNQSRRLRHFVLMGGSWRWLLVLILILPELSRGGVQRLSRLVQYG